MMRPLLLLALLAFPISILASQCGTSAVPFSLEVLDTGHLILGCSRPVCFGWNADGSPLPDSSQFSPIQGTFEGAADGFIREDATSVNAFNSANSPPQEVTCSESFGPDACSADQWVGGITPNVTGMEGVHVKCCSYAPLAQAQDRGQANIGFGQIFVGGAGVANGARHFDVVTNVQKLTNPDGSVGYAASVKRFNCPDLSPIAPLNAQGIPQGPNFNPNAFQPIPQAAAPAAAAAPYYPPASPMFAGIPISGFSGLSGLAGLSGISSYLCFPAESLVEVSTGSMKRMDALEVGDFAMTIGKDGLEYSEVEYFLHRNTEDPAEFLRFHLDDGADLALSAKHYLFATHCSNMVSPSSETLQKLKADQLKPGMCLMRSSGNFVKVLSVEKFESIGYYAPQTSLSTMFVNDIYVSCTAEKDYPHLQRNLFKNIYIMFEKSTIFGNEFFFTGIISSLLQVFSVVAP